MAAVAAVEEIATGGPPVKEAELRELQVCIENDGKMKAV